MQHMLCSDLEGVFVPEIWINVAEKTGIEELRLTTRDISDYNVLMDKRLSILDAHGLTLNDIQAVIAEIEPLPGALEFLDAIRAEHQIIIVSDTFLEFAGPLMEKLKRPTLFCNCLQVADTGRITGYELRQENGKKKTTRALQDAANRRQCLFVPASGKRGPGVPPNCRGIRIRSTRGPDPGSGIFLPLLENRNSGRCCTFRQPARALYSRCTFSPGPQPTGSPGCVRMR